MTLPEATSGNAPLGYALSGLPSTLTFDEATRTVRGTPGGSDVGGHTLTYTATDYDADTAEANFTLTIEDDTVPTVTADDRTVAPDEAQNVTLPEGSGATRH